MTPAPSPTAARLNAASLGALLDTVAEAVVVFDSAGQIHLANRAARALPHVAAARTLDDLAAALDADAVAWLRRLRGTAPPQTVTQPALAADGRRVTLELSRLPGGLWSLRLRPSEAAAAGAAPEELQQWFDLSPVGMVMVDEQGWLVRSNPAFAALVGRLPLALADADESLRELLGWDAEASSPADAVVERHASVALPDGQRRRLAARLRVIEPQPGQRRLLAVVEDRSAEDERDLARLEIGALMDTAGIGVATFDESRGWLRSTAPRLADAEAGSASRAGAGASVHGAQAISRDLVDPPSLPEYERLQRALKSGERVQVRYAVRHPELGLRWLLTRVEPGRLTSGRRTLSVVTLDVTEQERSREQLLVQADRTRAVLDSVLVGIVTVREGAIEWMNRSARRMFGGELADFVGRPIDAVATDEGEHPLRRADYARVLAEGQAETFECRLRARDGRTFWVVGNVVVTGPQLTFALLDIERRRQAELRSAQTQASLERIIETAPMAIGLLDAATLRVLQLNQMAAAFLGCALDGAVGQPVDELFGAAAEEAAALRADLLQALATREVTQREYRRPGGDGGAERVWDARYVPLRSTDAGGAGQLLLVASDVTAQRVAEAARLREEIAQRDMLVKEVHHRIKNNLQGVAGLMQQIAERRPEVAAVIKEAVGQVQAIAQVYGLQVGTGGPLRIRSVLEAIAASVQRMFGHPIGVEVQGSAAHRWALPEAESIPIALTVNELLTNAVKHGTGGLVRCTLECGEAQVTIVVANAGRLPLGFDLARVPGGVSGLGLVRALLPRRHAALAIGTAGDEVHARVSLTPPVVLALEPI
jgi:PAS domain S-box-containing protein